MNQPTLFSGSIPRWAVRAWIASLIVILPIAVLAWGYLFGCGFSQGNCDSIITISDQVFILAATLYSLLPVAILSRFLRHRLLTTKISSGNGQVPDITESVSLDFGAISIAGIGVGLIFVCLPLVTLLRFIHAEVAFGIGDSFVFAAGDIWITIFITAIHFLSGCLLVWLRLTRSNANTLIAVLLVPFFLSLLLSNTFFPGNIFFRSSILFLVFAVSLVCLELIVWKHRAVWISGVVGLLLFSLMSVLLYNAVYTSSTEEQGQAIISCTQFIQRKYEEFTGVNGRGAFESPELRQVWIRQARKILDQYTPRCQEAKTAKDFDTVSNSFYNMLESSFLPLQEIDSARTSCRLNIRSIVDSSCRKSPFQSLTFL